MRSPAAAASASASAARTRMRSSASRATAASFSTAARRSTVLTRSLLTPVHACVCVRVREIAPCHIPTDPSSCMRSDTNAPQLYRTHESLWQPAMRASASARQRSSVAARARACCGCAGCKVVSISQLAWHAGLSCPHALVQEHTQTVHALTNPF